MVNESLQKRGPRIALFALVVATLIRVWIGPFNVETRVLGQIPDAGAQRKQLADEVRRTNDLLLEIRDLLKTGTLNVRMEGTDNPSRAPLPPPGPGN